MRHIYLSSNKERMVIYDERENEITILSRIASQDPRTEEGYEVVGSTKYHRPAAAPAHSNVDDEEKDLEQGGEELGEDELKENIDELRDSGMTSREVAKKLRLPLAKINELWD